MSNPIEDSVDLSNLAVQAEKAKNHASAAELHSRALELKISVLGDNRLPTAISMNGLGGVLMKVGRLDEAENMLMKAFAIREKQGPRFDLAITREYIGALREAQGRREDAIGIRKRGGLDGKEEVCPGEMFAMEHLKRCGGCRAPNYCSVDCQKADWKSRHKALCPALKASIANTTKNVLSGNGKEPYREK